MAPVLVVLGLLVVAAGLTLAFRVEPKRIDQPPAIERPAPLAPAVTAPSAPAPAAPEHEPKLDRQES